MARQPWFERHFEVGMSAERLPGILERLRGTAARLDERLAPISPDALTRRVDGRWSIQENVGHLLDLEELWDRRLDDFDAGRDTLQPADLQNRKTHDADHNLRGIADLLAEFRRVRRAIVERLERLSDAQIARTAVHPRLQQPMSVVDLCFFDAEHDDHHLATISELLRGSGSR
jgi:uncharacterized damage-inducible protein DinB